MNKIMLGEQQPPMGNFFGSIHFVLILSFASYSVPSFLHPWTTLVSHFQFWILHKPLHMNDEFWCPCPITLSSIVAHTHHLVDPLQAVLGKDSESTVNSKLWVLTMTLTSWLVNVLSTQKRQTISPKNYRLLDWKSAEFWPTGNWHYISHFQPLPDTIPPSHRSVTRNHNSPISSDSQIHPLFMLCPFASLLYWISLDFETGPNLVPRWSPECSPHSQSYSYINSPELGLIKISCLV